MNLRSSRASHAKSCTTIPSIHDASTLGDCRPERLLYLLRRGQLTPIYMPQSQCTQVWPVGSPTILFLHSPLCDKANDDAHPRSVRLRPFPKTGHPSRPSFSTAIVTP